ncbi:MAG: hypothetical protein U0165_20315 [Polyangiaceae bacterium]
MTAPTPGSAPEKKCPTCGAANSAHITECWNCRYPLDRVVPAEGAPMAPADPKLEKGWFIGAAFASFLLVIVFIEGLFLAPAAALIYGLIVAPLIAYLLRITWPRNTTDVRRTLAISMVVVLSIIGLGLFVLTSAAVLFAIVCGGMKI